MRFFRAKSKSKDLISHFSIEGYSLGFFEVEFYNGYYIVDNYNIA